ncbi:U-box domain-containing protein 51-like [Ananas comosus]|uniref:RING-type E3 ubiquitin transferase n=1 Tax=Ananas comosus TaxID=4615 RepID=A0A6P5G3M3_ANACO|nr:U-box domain-containing protein 51-like [Ananas comosus]
MSQRDYSEGAAFPLVAVAIDKDKGSQNALKWALDNIISRGQTITLIHVNTGKTPSSGLQEDSANGARDIFIPFRIFCKRKDVHCKDIILDETDVAKAVIEFISHAAIEKLAVGAPSRGFVRFKGTDVSTSISRNAPDFCTVYVISKGKVSSQRNAVRAAPAVSPLRAQIQNQSSIKPDLVNQQSLNATKAEAAWETRNPYTEKDSIRSIPFLVIVTLTRLSLNMQEDIEAEMKRLRLELKQTMDMYSTACREALVAKQKAMELHRWKLEEAHRLGEARLAEEAALALAEKERTKCMAALEAAEASKRIAELEAQKRINAEKKALQESEEKKKALSALAQTDARYRKYSIVEIEAATDYFADSRKIGEGGYGPVYKCYLDHTPVAIKVLRPDAAQGREQFQQEVEILSCIRHPNMVLLLGACPEYGCLVYEYMANGSLEDRLFRRGNTPPIPWQHRFRISAEIGTGLLFLHQTKPEPLVHRDLKPANILLDRNYVSKISDVGLARLVPPSVANNVTQYRMTSTAGTFCYIDPEYQQTGMLGIKSDIYSLGILLLQLITAKPPMGLTHYVERAIEKGTFREMLDPTVADWPVEDACRLAEVALKCAELRRKDRPDLGTVVLPELNRLRALGEENLQFCVMGSSSTATSFSGQFSMPDFMTDANPTQSGYESSRSRSSAYYS